MRSADLFRPGSFASDNFMVKNTKVRLTKTGDNSLTLKPFVNHIYPAVAYMTIAFE